MADANVLRPRPGGAMDHWGNGVGTDALSRMSTCRGRVAMARWAIETAEAGRMLHCRCQRPEAALRWCYGPPRHWVRHGCFIADVNVPGPGHNDAMGH